MVNKRRWLNIEILNKDVRQVYSKWERPESFTLHFYRIAMAWWVAGFKLVSQLSQSLDLINKRCD